MEIYCEVLCFRRRIVRKLSVFRVPSLPDRLHGGSNNEKIIKPALVRVSLRVIFLGERMHETHFKTYPSLP